jgi:hypothetical protein
MIRVFMATNLKLSITGLESASMHVAEKEFYVLCDNNIENVT